MEIAIIPHFIIRKLFSDETNQIHANVLLTSMAVIAALLFWHNLYFYLSSIPHFCVFQKLLTIPCPGCRVTRSILAVIEGNMLSAWEYNPAGLFLYFFFIAQIPLRIIALKFRASQNLISQVSRIGSKAVVVVLLSVWVARLTK
jgi:hypothetical protein